MTRPSRLRFCAARDGGIGPLIAITSVAASVPLVIKTKRTTDHPANGRSGDAASKRDVVVTGLGKGVIGVDGVVRAVRSPPAPG